MDVVTGEVLLSQTDVDLPGVLPLLLERTHISTYGAGHLFGRTWASTLDQHLELDSEGVYYLTEDARVLKFPQALLPNVQFRPVAGPQWPLVLTSDGGYTLTDPQLGRTLHFPAPGEEHGWTRLPLTAISDRNGNRIDFLYEDQVLVEVRHSGGYRIAVDSAPLDAESSRTERRLTALRLLVPDADDITLIRFGYDAEGNLAEVINSSGRPLRFTYDDRGVLTSITRPDGGRTTVVHNALRLPVEITDAAGGVWRQSYDEAGNLTATVDPGGRTVRYVRGAGGGVVSVTGPNGATSRFALDALGLPTSATGPRGEVTHYSRDAAGRITMITDSTGGVVRYGWTVEGLPAWRTRADGATERWRYDAEGNLVEHIDEMGQTTRYEIGPFDEPTARTTPDGARLEFEYDTELRLTSVTNAQGLVWRYAYDAIGNPVTEQDFNGRTLCYAYDVAGHLVSRTNGAGQTITFTRDLSGNVIEKRFGDQITTFAYDSVGRMLRAVNADADLRLERDVSGRVVAEICNDRVLAVAYDAMGNVTHRRTPSGAESRWTYDADGHPSSLSMAGHTMRFEYDAVGREVQRCIDDKTILAQQWDGAHRLTTQTIWGAPEPSVHSGHHSAQARLLQHRSYAYRPDGSVTGVGDRLAGDRRYELDRIGQITAVHARDWTERYAYDDAGNITRAEWPTKRHGESGREADGVGSREYSGTLIRRAGGIRYEHDAQGRTIMRRHQTLSGRRSIWRYHWDAEDRLVAVQTPDGRSWRYRYDAVGRRIAKQRLTGDGQVVEQVEFVWDGAVLVEQAHTTWVAARREWVVRGTCWEYEPDTFRPLAQVDRFPAKDAPKHWIDRAFHAIVTDLTGSPAEFIDHAGQVSQRESAALWGATTSTELNAPPCPLRFPGQYHDQETGLHYNFQRYYDPSTGRYESSDPIGLAGGTAPHSYVVNPLTLTDPLGLAAYKPETGRQSRSNARNAYRGKSQEAPGGQSGPPVSLNQLRQEMGRAGMWHHVRDYDIVHKPTIDGPPGRIIYGNSPYNVDGTPKLGPTGRPMIEISDHGLSNMEQAVRTVFHESWHQQNLAKRGVPGLEGPADLHEEKMYQEYLRRRRGRNL
ncbi:RHS repeat-associated core domain-containing protein [Spirillospora sp. NPDC050679]